MEEHLPSMHEALSLLPTTAKEKEKEKEQEMEKKKKKRNICHFASILLCSKHPFHNI
jgi:hypothetical protein